MFLLKGLRLQGGFEVKTEMCPNPKKKQHVVSYKSTFQPRTKTPGCLLYIGDYDTQLNGDYI